MSLSSQFDSIRAQSKKAEGGKVALGNQLMPPKIQAKIKKVQFILDVVKGVSLLVSMFTGGLDGFSVGTFLLVGNGELIASQFTSWYPMPKWKKMVIYWCDAIIVVLALVVFGIVFLAYVCKQEIYECTKIIPADLYLIMIKAIW